MYQAVIFDLDGTLLDTLADITWALNTALAEHGLPTHSPAAVRAMVGHGLGELVRKALAASGHTIPEGPSVPPATLPHDLILARVRHLYLDSPVRDTSPYPGIQEILADLRAKGVRLGVLTNKVHGIATRIVDHFFPGIFDAVQGEEAGLARKPHPAGVGHLLDRMSARGLSTVLVGDSDADVHTAANAGIGCIAVSWGFRDHPELAAAGATTIVDTTAGLRFLLGLD